MSVKLLVKWGKKKFKDVEVDTAGTLDDLRAQLMSLTGVPPDMQKILIKGKMLKEDSDLAKLTSKSKLMLMGSAAPLAPEPEAKTVFLEDLSAAEQNKLDLSTGAGMVNLGNTCYMNSTLQCLRHIPELKETLNTYNKNPSRGDIAHEMTTSLGYLFEELDGSREPVTPARFTSVLRTAVPTFNERSEKTGGYMQQDAEECLGQILSYTKQKLSNDKLPAKLREGEDAKSLRANAIDTLFAGEFEVTQDCLEAPDEPTSTSKELFWKLRCHIDGETNYLYQGITEALEEKLERSSPSLGTSAVYRKTYRIVGMPRVLVVQFVRFFWRQDTQQKTKVLRRVKFPEKLDIMPYCSYSLKSELSAARDALKAEKDAELGLTPLGSELKQRKKIDLSGDAEDSGASAPAVDKKLLDKNADPHKQTSGFYELFGVVTHKGRAADGGHYVGWARQVGDEWLKFDDEKVTNVSTQDILNLSGGGDWHMSYLAMYRRVDDMVNFDPVHTKQLAQEKASQEAQTNDDDDEDDNKTNNNNNDGNDNATPMDTSK